VTSPPPGPPGHPPPYGYLPSGYAPPGFVPPPGYQPPGYRPPPPVSPGGQPLASFPDRLLAYLLDAVVFGAVIMAIALPVLLITFFSVLPELEVDQYGQPVDVNPFALVGPLLLVELGLIVLALALGYVYYVEMMFRSGQTLGKKVLKIQVVPLDPACSLNRTMAAKRYLGQHVAGSVVPFYTYVDGLWQLWDKPFQQCLHDKFAQTVVVKVGMP
jgi:uncharacterized RDD family membrane protein YckC